MLEAATAVHVRDHRRGQQFAVLHDVDTAVGEAPLVAQRNHVEFQILRGIAAGDEVRRQRARRQVVIERAAGGDERLGHHLPAERADRVLARMRADERVVVDAIEVEYRQQLFEVCR